MMKMTVVGELPSGCLLDASWCIRFALIVRAVDPPQQGLAWPHILFAGVLSSWMEAQVSTLMRMAGPMSGEHVGRLRGSFTL